MIKTLFIVGYPRSGTKLLLQILKTHPSISGPNVEVNLAHKLSSKTSDSEFKKLVVCSVYPGKLPEEINQLNLSCSDLNLEFFIHNIIPVTQELCVSSAQEFEEKWQAAIVDRNLQDEETLYLVMDLMPSKQVAVSACLVRYYVTSY